MSEGPIKSARDAWKPPVVSTPDNQRVCRLTAAGRAYCGRRKSPLVDSWNRTTCTDCQAGGRADGALK